MTLPEGNEITFNQHMTGRYMDVQDWGTTQRCWTFTYNVCDQLAKVTDPEMDTKQLFYVNGSDDEDLNSNLVRVLLGGSRDLLMVEYDTSDRVMHLNFKSEFGAITDLTQAARLRWYIDGLKRRPVA